MTDELSSEQEAAVRRLLAEARHAEPVPADVAARLDEVLEGLVADEGVDDLERHGSIPVLAGVRRRRRNAGRLLLAAAAVVIGGVAIGQALGNTGLDDASDAADSAAGGQAEAPRDSTSRDEAEADGGGIGNESALPSESGAVTTPTSGQALLDLTRAPLSLTSKNFAADVQRELKQTAGQWRNAALADYDGVHAYTLKNGDFVCAKGAYGEGAKLPAYYDAEEAVLVLRRPRAGIQRADLLTCGTAVELNSVDLEAR